MPETDAQSLVQRIHGRGVPAVLAITGGGSGAVSALLGMPGASRTVLEAVIPYAPSAMAAFLGGMPDQFCSDRTAQSMAMAAYLRACSYRADSIARSVLGVGATCSLASDRPKRGSHRIFAACQSASATRSCSLELTKGGRGRADEEAVASALMLNLLAEACGLEDRLAIPLLAREHIQFAKAEAPAVWQDLLAGRTALVLPGGQRQLKDVVFPGAFNPLHDGHREMARIAERLLGRRVDFEISIVNVDKPPLDFLEMRTRAEQFGDDLLFTRAPTFLEKSKLFPGATFLVGSDTLRRIGEPKYYGDESQMQAAIHSIRESGCKFLVFGRTENAEFRTVERLDIPEALKALCTQVPQSNFQMDVSSTELRRSESAGG